MSKEGQDSMAAGADAQEDELKGTLNSEDEAEAQALAEALISALNLSEKPKKEDSDQDSTSEQPESGSDDSELGSGDIKVDLRKNDLTSNTSDAEERQSSTST